MEAMRARRTAKLSGVLAYDAEQKVSVDFQPYRTFIDLRPGTKAKVVRAHASGARSGVVR